MSLLKKLAGETALYGLSTIVGRLLNYLLVAYYTRVFQPEQYGIVTELFAYAAFFNVIYTIGMETTFFRFAGKDQDRASTWFSRALTLILIFGGSITGLIIAFSQGIANYLQYPDYPQFVAWMGVILFIDAICALPFAWLRLEGRPKRFVTIKLGNIFLNIFFNLLFITGLTHPKIYHDLPVELKKIAADPNELVGMVFLANLLANAFQIPALWPWISKLKFLWDTQTAKMLHYGFPLMVMGLAGMVDEMLGRIFLKQLLPKDYYQGRTAQAALGIYGACYKLSIFMTLAIQAFRYAADPFFFSKAENKNAPELFAKVMDWFVAACLLIFIGVNLNLDWISAIFLGKSAYLEGLVVVPILLLANLFLGIYYNLSIWFKLTDKTYFGTGLSLFGAVVTLIGNFLLIPILGYYGSALTTLLCYFLMAGSSMALGQKYYPIPYRWGTILLQIIGSTVIVYSFEALSFQASTQVSWALRIAAFAIFILLMYITLFRKEFRTHVS